MRQARRISTNHHCHAIIIIIIIVSLLIVSSSQTIALRPGSVRRLVRNQFIRNKNSIERRSSSSSTTSPQPTLSASYSSTSRKGQSSVPTTFGQALLLEGHSSAILTPVPTASAFARNDDTTMDASGGIQLGRRVGTKTAVANGNGRGSGILGGAMVMTSINNGMVRSGGAGSSMRYRGAYQLIEEEEGDNVLSSRWRQRSNGILSFGPSSTFRTWRDRLLRISNWASILCAIDCTVLPIVTAILPLLGSVPSLQQYNAKWLCDAGHGVALYFVLPVGSLTATLHFGSHRQLRPFALSLVALTVIFMANTHGSFLTTLGIPHGLRHQLHCGPLHRIINIMGCALLLTSNRWAQKLSNRACLLANCIECSDDGGLLSFFFGTTLTTNNTTTTTPTPLPSSSWQAQWEKTFETNDNGMLVVKNQNHNGNTSSSGSHLDPRDNNAPIPMDELLV